MSVRRVKAWRLSATAPDGVVERQEVGFAALRGVVDDFALRGFRDFAIRPKFGTAEYVPVRRSEGAAHES